MIIHHDLPSVDVVVNELLAKEICIFNPASNKGIFSTPPLVFAYPNNKGNFQGKVSRDEHNYCKQKGNWKAQCPKLLKSQQQPQW